MNDSDNPYASPPCSGIGFWDKTLFRQIVKALAKLTACFSVMNVVIWIQFFVSNPTTVERVGKLRLLQAFFTEWNSL